MSKHTNTSYWVEVWTSTHGYVEWGIHYPNKEDAIGHIKKYLQDISRPGSALAASEYYQQQYKDYTSHPIKLCSQTYVTEVFPVEKQEINI